MKLFIANVFRVTGFVLLAATASPAALSQDAKGCKDHPLFTRISGYNISQCKKDYNQLLILIDANPKSEKNIKPEGDLTFTRYIFKKSAEQPNPPSDLQVMRNYQNAASAIGGTILVDRPQYTAFKFNRDGGLVYAVARMINNGGFTMAIEVLEEKKMVQEVSGNLLWEKLNKDGFLSFQINFDTNKSIIKPDSAPLVKQIADLMKSQPSLAVSIEGHTDNQGNAVANKTLSLERAKAVTAAVAAQGVQSTRMETLGWGQEKPVADNRSEEGRAINRRVELVKKH